MTGILSICVAVTFAVSVYLLLNRELKSIAMGVFLLGHAANLSIIAMSGSPVSRTEDGIQMKLPPILGTGEADSLVDPLPQALILTAIVIGFAVMGFLLTLLVTTSRKTGTLSVTELAESARQEDEE